jgi:hypothetical protein
MGKSARLEGRGMQGGASLSKDDGPTFGKTCPHSLQAPRTLRPN